MSGSQARSTQAAQALADAKPAGSGEGAQGGDAQVPRTRARLPAAPSDLGAEGRALWRDVHAWLREYGLRLDPHEEPLVAELARTADRLASARNALAGLEPSSPAWVRLAGEERQQRLAYGRVVAAIGLPTGLVGDAGDNVVGYLSTASRRGLKAARARWGQAGGEPHRAP